MEAESTVGEQQLTSPQRQTKSPAQVSKREGIKIRKTKFNCGSLECEKV